VVTRNELSDWFDEGLKEKATHMIVVCDTYDYEDYPVFVSANEDVREIEKEHKGKSMQMIMEVYNLSMNKEEQIAAVRAFNY